MHQPVLLKGVIEFLNPQPGETFVDATLGDGGHAIEIIKRLGENGRFLGIDADEEAIKAAESRIKNQELRIKELIIVKDNFVNLKNIIQKYNFAPVHGILFDLGLRSEQLDESGRGFSFLRDEPLDMRFDEKGDYPTAAEILNSAPVEELESIFRKFGEERFSKDIAQGIVFTRKKAKPRTSTTLGERGAGNNGFATTSELVALVLSVYKRRLHSAKDVPWVRGGIHPATRVFQALRIAVNHELENLEKVLPEAVQVLAPGGRLAVIAFHSLEDRIVKHFFRSREDLKILTKKPIVPSEKEIENNPRSRSAKLRVAIKNE